MGDPNKTDESNHYMSTIGKPLTSSACDSFKNCPVSSQEVISEEYCNSFYANEDDEFNLPRESEPSDKYTEGEASDNQSSLDVVAQDYEVLEATKKSLEEIGEYSLQSGSNHDNTTPFLTDRDLIEFDHSSRIPHQHNQRRVLQPSYRQTHRSPVSTRTRMIPLTPNCSNAQVSEEYMSVLHKAQDKSKCSRFSIDSKLSYDTGDSGDNTITADKDYHSSSQSTNQLNSKPTIRNVTRQENTDLHRNHSRNEPSTNPLGSNLLMECLDSKMSFHSVRGDDRTSVECSYNDNNSNSASSCYEDSSDILLSLDSTKELRTYPSYEDEPESPSHLPVHRSSRLAHVSMNVDNFLPDYQEHQSKSRNYFHHSRHSSLGKSSTHNNSKSHGILVSGESKHLNSHHKSHSSTARSSKNRSTLYPSKKSHPSSKNNSSQRSGNMQTSDDNSSNLDFFKDDNIDVTRTFEQMNEDDVERIAEAGNEELMGALNDDFNNEHFDDSAGKYTDV